MDRLNKPRLQN